MTIIKVWVRLAMLLLLTGILCCGHENSAEPTDQPNADSLRCAALWQQFTIAKDSLLELRYQKPVTLTSGKDKMSICVVEIMDGCSEESSKYTWGCDVRVRLEFKLNDDCAYIIKYPLRFSRYSDVIMFSDIKKTGCGSLTNALIENRNVEIHHMSFYNTTVSLSQLKPFLKTNAELESFDKKNYIIRLGVRIRCP